MVQQVDVLYKKRLASLRGKKIFFSDRDGTLVLDNKLLPEANAFIERLTREKKHFFVFTNDSSKTPQQHFINLKKSGLDISLENVLVSSMVAIDYLKEKKYTSAYILANNEVTKYITDHGIRHTATDPDVILLTFDNTITYEKLATAGKLILKGTPYLATHPDHVYITKEHPLPDVGSFIELLRVVTGKTPHKIFGKPNQTMLTSVLKKYDLQMEDAVIIGDRLYTDIKMAENNGLTSILVLTGETTLEEYKKSEIKADIVIPTLEDLLPYI